MDEWGPWGYLAYAAVYTGLEVLAVPAIPLTMTAGECTSNSTNTNTRNRAAGAGSEWIRVQEPGVVGAQARKAGQAGGLNETGACC